MTEKKSLLITYPNIDSINEAIALADASGYFVDEIVKQKHITRSKFGIGSGKALDVKNIIKTKNLHFILFDEVLKPNQQYNLARLCNVDVIDRERLILEIFERRASTSESRIQIKLAQLRYDMVRAREKVRLAKMGEQPGFFGLGKYDADIYFLDIKNRMTFLQKKLKKAEIRRSLYRSNRLKNNLPTISLVGYTSSGKTTLFNTMTGESKVTGKGMFTTLSTFTRSINLPDGKVLISDTVGFVNKLPAYMIEAFKSTLHELLYSDLILLVIDISQSIFEIEKRLKSSLHVMNELGVSLNKVLYLLNKTDLIGIESAYEKFSSLQIINPKGTFVLPISAYYGLNIDKLKIFINELVFKI